jgi:hypothetical protein
MKRTALMFGAGALAWPDGLRFARWPRLRRLLQGVGFSGSAAHAWEGSK